MPLERIQSDNVNWDSPLKASAKSSIVTMPSLPSKLTDPPPPKGSSVTHSTPPDKVPAAAPKVGAAVSPSWSLNTQPLSGAGGAWAWACVCPRNKHRATNGANALHVISRCHTLAKYWVIRWYFIVLWLRVGLVFNATEVIKRCANGGRNIQTWLPGYQYNPVIPSKATTFICNTMCFKGWCLGNSSSTAS